MNKWLLIVTTLFIFQSNGLAEDGAKKFDEKKTKVLSNLDKRISYLNELKSCVQNASKKQQLKKCRKDHQSKIEKFRSENQKMRKNK